MNLKNKTKQKTGIKIQSGQKSTCHVTKTTKANKQNKQIQLVQILSTARLVQVSTPPGLSFISFKIPLERSLCPSTQRTGLLQTMLCLYGFRRLTHCLLPVNPHFYVANVIQRWWGRGGSCDEHIALIPVQYSGEHPTTAWTQKNICISYLVTNVFESLLSAVSY